MTAALRAWLGVSQQAAAALDALLYAPDGITRADLAQTLSVGRREAARLIRELRDAMDPRAIAYDARLDGWRLTAAGRDECEDAAFSRRAA